METIKKALKSIGLARDSATIYSLLLSDGPQKASDLVRKSHISRQLVYRAMEDLEERQLVTATKRAGKVTIFEAQDPRQLRQNLDREVQQLAGNQALLESLLPTLLANFMKQTDKPIFQFEDTLGGIGDIFHSAHLSGETIYQYADPEVFKRPEFSAMADRITRERIKHGVTKFLFYPDTPGAHEALGVSRPDLEKKILRDIPAFDVILLVWGETSALITSRGGSIQGFTIQDPGLSSLLKQFLITLSKQ